jgi:hypothetical protein
MLSRLLGKLFRRSAPTAAGLGGRMLELLETRGSLVLDADALAELGAGRDWVRRVAQILAWRERLHLLSEADGAWVLLSNSQFDRITRIQASFAAEGLAKTTVAAAGLQAAVPADGGSVSEPVSEAADTMDSVAEVEVSAAAECEWFRLEVAIAEMEEDELDREMAVLRNMVSPDGQKLPERRRESGVDLGAAVLAAEK